MRYPMLNNWLVFSRKNQYEYDVHDCLYDEDFTMGVTIAVNGKLYLSHLGKKGNEYLSHPTKPL